MIERSNFIRIHMKYNPCIVPSSITAQEFLTLWWHWITALAFLELHCFCIAWLWPCLMPCYPRMHSELILNTLLYVCRALVLWFLVELRSSSVLLALMECVRSSDRSRTWTPVCWNSTSAQSKRYVLEECTKRSTEKFAVGLKVWHVILLCT